MSVFVTGTDCNVTYADASDGCCGATGKYWLTAKIDGEEHGRQEIYAPGVAGAAIARVGFRRREIPEVDVMYVNTSSVACFAAAEADHDTMVGKALAVTLYGVAHVGCELSGFLVTKGPMPTQENTRFRMHVRLRFVQVRNA